MAKKPPNLTDKHVGSRVRMRRLMLGMSQEKLGERLGITFQQVQKYEKGVNRVCASRLQQIGAILQVPIPFFFEGAPAAQVVGVTVKSAEAESPAFVTAFTANSDGLRLAKAFQRIADRELRRAIVVIAEQSAKATA